VRSTTRSQSPQYATRIRVCALKGMPCCASIHAVLGSSAVYRAGVPRGLKRPPWRAAPSPEAGAKAQRGSCAPHRTQRRPTFQR
jgi:hypothetical protein